MSDLFRKNALDQLNSPEQLDQMMQVTDQKAWLALSGLAVLIFSALLWSLFGAIPSRISGPCVLIKTSGLLQVVSQSTGQIESIASLKAGDRIIKGQRIATLSQPLLTSQYASDKLKLNDLERHAIYIKQSNEQTLSLNRLHTNKKLEEIAIGKKAKHILTNSLALILNSQNDLLRDGIITRQSYENTRQTFFQAQQDIQSFDAQIRQFAHDQLVAEATAQLQLREINERVQAAQAEFHQRETELKQKSEIISPFTGQIVEITAHQGDVIASQMAILDLQDESAPTEALLYVPPYGEAKNIKAGMTVQLSPNNTKREEFGFILGKVTEVSLFPSSREGMIAKFRHPRVVEKIVSGGPVMTVNVELLTDQKTHSGFKWSSSAGSKVKVTVGTLCTAEIKLREQPPITLVMPWLKYLFGLD